MGVPRPTRVARTWGTTAAEREREFPCDRHVPADGALYRGIDVEAPAPVVFRWLCQLRAAPYSYDLIDNFGRRSPRRLTPGLERLEPGQRFMTIFRLVGFEQDRHVTLRSRKIAVTYLVEPTGPGGSRLVVKIVGLGGRIMPIADLS